MPIKFQCVHCGAPIKAPDTHAGETLPCPKCGEPVLVASAPLPPPPPSGPPQVSVPPTFAPPPSIGVFVGNDDDDEVVPRIVTGDTSSSAPPELAFVGTAPPSSAPYVSPRGRGSQVGDVELQNVRVVDVRLSWGTVFWTAFQFYVCLLALSMVAGLVFLIFSMLAALLGIGIMGSMS